MAAQFLESAGGRDASIIAIHYERGGDLLRAIPLHERAGDDAARLGSLPKARQAYGHACSLLERLPNNPQRQRSRVELLLKQVQTSLVTNAPEQNLERLSLVHAALDALGGEAPTFEDQLRLARCFFLRGQVLHYGGRPTEALTHYQRALPLAQKLGADELFAQTSCVIGVALAVQGRMRQGRALIEQALGTVQETGAAPEWIRARCVYSVTLAATGDVARARAESSSALDAVQKLNQPSLFAMARMNHGQALFLAHDWQSAVECTTEAIRISQSSGDLLYVYGAYGLRAWANSFLGLHAAAEADRKERIHTAQPLGKQLIYAEFFAASDAEIALLAGRYEEALQRALIIGEAAAAADLLTTRGIAERVVASALARLGGDAAESDRHFALATSIFAEGGNVLEIALVRIYHAQALRMRGDTAAADKELAQALAQLEICGCTYALSHAHRLALS